MKPVSTAFVVFTVTFVLASLLAAAVAVTIPWLVEHLESLFDSDTGTVVLEIGKAIMPVLLGSVIAAAVTSWYLRRSSAQPRARASGVRIAGLLAGTIFVVAFTLTWLRGVPAVISKLDREVLESFREEAVSPDFHQHPPGKGYPWLETEIAFPIAPGLIVTRHSYLFGPLAGRGAWQLHWWCFGEPKELFEGISWVA